MIFSLFDTARIRVRLTLDATPLLAESAGVKTYLYYWAQELRVTKGSNHLSLFPWLRPAALDHRESRYRWGRADFRLTAVGLINSPRVPLGWMLDVALARADIFHASPQTLKLPRRPRVTATVFDMSCWTVPETHTPENIRATKIYAGAVLKHAHGLIAISESTQSDAIRILALPAERIRVIYPGVAESFFQVASDSMERVRTDYSLTKPFVLFVGTIEPRKNVDILLDAWQSLPPDVRSNHDLVLVGAMGWCHPKTAERLQMQTHGIRYLGYVPEEHLPRLDRHGNGVHLPFAV